MPWHLSRSDPRKVYDSYHRAVCVCQTTEQAALIAHAVNALAHDAADTFIRLREPSGSPGKESGEVGQSGGASEHAKADAPLTHVCQTDGCCAKLIAKASLSGVLDRLQPWECGKCGTTYWPKREGPVVNWEARAAAIVFST